MCHNYYQQPGGEDVSYESEVSLLRSRGHDVLTYTVHNNDIDQIGRIALARKTIWNQQTYRDLSELIRREQPEIMHCTNTFPLISPAAYHAARREDVAIVQSLRNYRLLCPNTYFLRDGKICENCLGKSLPIAAITHACYRGSRAASAVVTAMLGVHNMLKTWNRAVDLFFCPSEFTRQKFIEGGFAEEQVVVKPNFVSPDPGPGTGRGNYAVFVGRLSPEKDIETLLQAWAQLPNKLPLKIIGDGPLADRVAQAQEGEDIEWLGHRPLDQVLSVIGDAAFLIMPSVWYETFGRTIVEAFAKGTPAIVSNLGAMAELVDDGVTGLHFEAGDPNDLASKVTNMFSDPAKLAKMRGAARAIFVQKFSAERNYEMLLSVYRIARKNLSKRSHAN